MVIYPVSIQIKMKARHPSEKFINVTWGMHRLI